MFILALTSYGVRQRLLTYDRMSDVPARAATPPPPPQTEADKSKVYKAPSVEEQRGGVAMAPAMRRENRKNTQEKAAEA